MKTLNDIRKHRIMDGTYSITEDTSLGITLDISEGATIHDLRQSAIEDIREMRKEIDEMDKYDCYCIFERHSKIEYIKDKFNITDEDLK